MKSQEITILLLLSIIRLSASKKGYQTILSRKIVTMAVTRNDSCTMWKETKKVETGHILNSLVATISKCIKKISLLHQGSKPHNQSR